MYRNKKLITFFIFIFAFMGSIGFPAREAKAVLLIDDAVLLVAAGLLTATGIVCLTNEGARAAATQFCLHAPVALMAKMEAAALAVGTLFYVDSVTWQDMKTAALGIQNENVTCAVPGVSVPYGTVKGAWVYHNYTPFFGTITLHTTSWIIDLNTDTVNITTNNAGFTIEWEKWYNATHYEYRPRVRKANTVLWTGTSSTSISLSSAPLVTVGAYADGTTVLVNSVVVYQDSISNKISQFSVWGADGSLGYLMQGTGIAIEEKEIIAALGTTYNITNNYNNPAWDITGQSVTTSTTWDETVNKQPSEVLDAGAVIYPPGTVAPTTTTDSWLQSLYGGITGVKTSVQGLAGAVTSFFDPTLPISVEPLKIVGITFTNKFPFSLPWDMLRSFQGLVGVGSWSGKIPIAAHSALANFDFDIDLSMFAGMLPIVKLFELVAFDIGLILATRKLMGGGV